MTKVKIKYVLASWHVRGNPPKEKICMDATAAAYKKHLESFAGENLMYFDIEDLEEREVEF